MVTTAPTSPLALSPENPMGRAMMGCLICQVIVFALAFPGMVVVSHTPVWLACVGTIVTVLLCLAAAARIRTPLGYLLGWAAQIAGILMGFLTPMMFFAGGLFAVIWLVTFVLGRRLESRTV